MRNTPDGGPAWLRHRQSPEYPETVDILVGQTVITASILDMSAEGIRLRLTLLNQIPNWTYMRFEDGEVFPVECLWQHSGEAGFRFAAESVAAELVSEIPDDERCALLSLIDSAMQRE